MKGSSSYKDVTKEQSSEDRLANKVRKGKERERHNTQQTIEALAQSRHREGYRLIHKSSLKFSTRSVTNGDRQKKGLQASFCSFPPLLNFQLPKKNLMAF